MTRRAHWLQKYTPTGAAETLAECETGRLWYIAHELKLRPGRSSRERLIDLILAEVFPQSCTPPDAATEPEQLSLL